MDEAEAKRCPGCAMRLWTKPRRLRFHDLGGTRASFLIQSGAGPAVVASVLRHSAPNLTMRRYTHMDPVYLRQEINKLSFSPASWQPPPEVQQVRVGKGAARPASRRLLNPRCKRFRGPETRRPVVPSFLKNYRPL
ncbi:hypothetical protein ACQKGO_29010 [Corallococcus interemptor]|uniref:hypothetical protein n=1 Tax=Corallococcus interemptor TaxID=2316720 RepID=UPI003CFF4F53